MAQYRLSGNVHILGPSDRPYRETEFFTRIPSRPLKEAHTHYSAMMNEAKEGMDYLEPLLKRDPTD